MADATDVTALEVDTVDPEMRAESDRKLKEAGLLDDDSGTPDNADDGVILEVPEDDAPAVTPTGKVKPEQEDSQAEVEVEVTEDEPPAEVYYGGKYDSKEAFERSYGEAERKITEQGQLIQQLSEPARIMSELMRTEEGALAIQRVLNPQSAQPQFEIPTDAAGYEKFIEEKGLYGGISETAKYVLRQETAPLMQEVQQLKSTLNSALGMFEELALEKKHGDLEPIKPMLDEVEQIFGDLAQYIPMDAKVRVAKRFAPQAATPESGRQPKTVPKEELQKKHREKVLAGSVESASVTSSEGRVIDIEGMSSAEMEAKGLVRRIERD